MKKKSSWAGRLFLFLFSLPFAAVGVFATVMIAWSVYDWVVMNSWVEVPCRILEAKLEVRQGDDSDTYKAIAHYEYEYQGKTYSGERVGINSTPDNIGSYHKSVIEELKQYQKTKKPFRCFVNPNEPQNAVLYRKLRIEMIGFMLIFSLVFGGVGFGLMFWSIYSVKYERAAAQLQTEHPGEPWQWKKEWADGEVESSTKGAMIGIFIFAALWNLISAPVIFIVPGEVKEGNNLALIGLLFPLVGAGLILATMYLFLRWRKYGDSTFCMASVPGVIGGQLAGVIYTKINVRPEDGYRVSLSCVETVTSGSGKNRRSRERIRWQDEKVLTRELAERDTARSVIPVQFNIPYEVPEASREDDNADIDWRLTVKAAVPGIDYSADFDVPVFKTPDSSPDFKPDATALSEYEAPLEPEFLARNARVLIQPTAGGQEIIFPMAQKPGVAAGVTLLLAVWIGFTILMLHLKAPIFFPIVFGLFGLLILLGVLDLWLWSSKIRTQPGAITFTTGILGLRKTRTYSVDEIQSLEPTTGMQAGNKIYYMLQLRTSDGKKYNIGKRLPSRSQAEHIVKIIMDSMTSTSAHT